MGDNKNEAQTVVLSDSLNAELRIRNTNKPYEQWAGITRSMEDLAEAILRSPEGTALFIKEIEGE